VWSRLHESQPAIMPQERRFMIVCHSPPWRRAQTQVCGKFTSQDMGKWCCLPGRLLGTPGFSLRSFLPLALCLSLRVAEPWPQESLLRLGQGLGGTSTVGGLASTVAPLRNLSSVQKGWLTGQRERPGAGCQHPPAPQSCGADWPCRLLG
jgi:hypothetical protein